MFYHQKRKSSQGSALIMAVVLIGVMSIGSAALWRYLHTTLREQTRNARTDTTQHLAEAGLEKALAILRTNRAYEGEQDTPLGEGTFSVVVERPGATDTYRILSTGKLEDDDIVRATQTLIGDVTLDAAGTIKTYRWKVHKELR